MKTKWKKTASRVGAAAAAVGLCATMMCSDARGAGLLIADGGFGGVLEMEEHDVHVTINNGVAVTRVTQVFRNTENRQVEALYTFPVPKGASVANFSMWINGKEMVGEVLEKNRAREIYNSYKRRRKDPGLLEQVDYKTFEMRIFPIGPKAEQKVEVAYYQELSVDHDWATYVYPLATATRENVDPRVSGKFAMTFEVKSAVPVTALESPSHSEDFAMAEHAPEYVQASLEQQGGSLARDVVLAYHLSRPKTGVDVVTSKEGGEDGYFSLSITAGDDLAQRDTGMDYVFLLDVSGSMGHDGKLPLSRGSIDAFIHELGAGDRFEVVTFNVQPHTLFGALREATPEAQAESDAFLGSQRARGGTVLHAAMKTAYKYGDPDRTLNVVILSDGMTEQAERRGLLQLIGERPRNARVFCIGVGNEVNRPLLEQIAEDTGGLASFISRGDNFARQAKAFRRKLMRPVATELALDFGGLRVYDVEPSVLPGLYHGSPIRVYGRYKDSGEATVTVRGNIQGADFKQSAAVSFPRKDSDNPEIERMWAWRKVDRLLKDADRSGARDRVVDEIVRLGEAYSIVTEYTSFLVLENDAEYRRWKIDRRNALRIERDRTAQSRLRAELDRIRDEAVADIGPQVEKRVEVAQARPSARSVPSPATPRTSTPRRSSGSSWDLDIGTGPVGPLLLGLMAWFSRRKRKIQA